MSYTSALYTVLQLAGLNNDNYKVQLWHSPLIISVLLVAGACIWHDRKRNSSRPPGPMGLPIVGHLHLLGDKPHRALFNLSKLHGSLMWLRFGSIRVLVASSPQAARLILQTHDHTFSGRPRSAAALALFNGCTDITFSPSNSCWRLLRQIFVTDLVSSKRVEASRHVREAEAHMLVGAIVRLMTGASSGSPSAEPNRHDAEDAKGTKFPVSANPKYAHARTERTDVATSNQTLLSTCCISWMSCYVALASSI
ncbi:hypothetical protein GOP47_0003618 [Adiantum capillus-veneris]|uniref:Cytochrome P450 n=1 Tax=Adiantum capillus-veneris TaxID=13818 RepID=A0A9D4V6M7_ADICA|nr:hypothetical protein GOP47_0003618 [Adiantum capillus-veneris]